MKRFSIVCAAGLILALLAGCGPASSPADAELRDAMREAADAVRDAVKDREDPAALEEAIGRMDAALERFGQTVDGLAGEEDVVEKHHYWQVLDGDGAEIARIDGAEAVDALDELLSSDMDGWDGLPDGAEAETPLYTYVFWQEETLEAGRDPAGRDYEELIRFGVYEDGDTVRIDVLPGAAPLLGLLGDGALLTFSARLPAEAAESLRDPAQFTTD